VKEFEVQAVNSEILTLIREARGLTQNELAVKSGVSQPTLSKYEHDLMQASDEHIHLLAIALDVPSRLLTKKDLIHPIGSVCLFHRKRESTSVREARRLHALINWRLLHLKWLLRGIPLLPAQTTEFPRYDYPDYGDPEDIAELVRQSLRIPHGPIKNLVANIERANRIVISFDFKSSSVDAMSAWESQLPPVFFINSTMPCDRIRMSLAHEIGHMVMHRNANPDQEDQAQRFASAFLLPERDIKDNLVNIDLPSAAMLKPYWRVSMQALIYRAYRLSVISEYKYTQLFKQLSKAGYRKREPNPIPGEHPENLRLLIAQLQENNLTLDDLSKIAELHKTEFIKMYLMQNFGEVA